MHFPMLTCTAFFLLAAPTFAQSVITLEDFDLNLDDPVQTVPAPEQRSTLELCLLDSSKCSGSKDKAGTDFSIEDVVNLKIESNAGTAIVPASTSSSSAQISEPLPSVDMEILFDYNSDTVRPDQMNQLFELAEVLNNDRLSNFTFLFVGHSDAKGSAAYNKDLSARRAQAVANFVQASARMPLGQFAASGMGSSRLKDVNDPFGALNRRVQLVLVPR